MKLSPIKYLNTDDINNILAIIERNNFIENKINQYKSISDINICLMNENKTNTDGNPLNVGDFMDDTSSMSLTQQYTVSFLKKNKNNFKLYFK